MCLLVSWVFVSAAILGLIISTMEKEGFPGWGSMIICVLAAAIPSAIVNALLPPELFIIGLALGAICAGAAISASCGMGVKRAIIAACIYLAIQAVLSTMLYLLMRPAS